VINDSSGALTIERNQDLVGAEADDSQRLILVDHREAEHLLVKGDRSLQVSELNAKVVDVRAVKLHFFLGDSSGSTGGEDSESLVSSLAG
jgi:hypothetical protein